MHSRLSSRPSHGYRLEAQLAVAVVEDEDVNYHRPHGSVDSEIFCRLSLDEARVIVEARISKLRQELQNLGVVVDG